MPEVTASMIPPSTRILVVDDSADHRESTAAVLACEGYDVRTAGTAAEALEAVESGFAPRVLLLDLLMPGTDGASLLRTLRARATPGDMRTVVVTGVVSSGLKRLLEVEEVLFKPVEPAELLAVVARMSA